MYAPQYPIKARSPSTPTPHLHSPEETLTDRENSDAFKTYLAGRHLAYTKVISETYSALTKANQVLDRNPHDPALRALADGQIEGLKEILAILHTAKDKHE